jgi:aspartokinase/homoserine dehydrogenase 1
LPILRMYFWIKNGHPTGKKIQTTFSYTIDDVIAYANEHHLENLIAIDNTASADFVTNYISLVENSFDLISSNKVANTLSYSF